jgi:KipI family sensor histidine kinase inhibitor
MSSVRILPLGDSAWTVEFGNEISPQLNSKVQGYAAQLQEAQSQGHFPEIIEVLPTFRSVTVYINPLLGDPVSLPKRLLDAAEHIQAKSMSGRRWAIPVCFGGEFGEDLEDVAKHAGLSTEQVIEQMLAATFKVYLLGFMPGFPFMGGLPEALSIPRLSTPRQKVPARTVAIAGVMGAIYPWESPGGWRLLGRTPIPLFDIQNVESPTLLSPGDEVVWRVIGLDEFSQIEQTFEKQQGRWSDFEVRS